MISLTPTVPAPQPVGERVMSVNPTPLLALKGEIVTRESGEPIATVAMDIRHGDPLGPGAFTDWTIEPPKPGELLPKDQPGRRWIRAWRRGVDIHLARG